MVILYGLISRWCAIALVCVQPPDLAAARFEYGQDQGIYYGQLRAGGRTTEIAITITNGQNALTCEMKAIDSAPTDCKVVTDKTGLAVYVTASTPVGPLTCQFLIPTEVSSSSSSALIKIGPFEVVAELTVSKSATPVATRPRVNRELEVLVGKWSFERVSTDDDVTRSPEAGQVIFRMEGRNFLVGLINSGIVMSKQEHRIVLAHHPSHAMTLMEQHGDRVIEAVGSWDNELAMDFRVRPIISNNRSISLTRVLYVRSIDQLEIVDDVSIDGASPTRLGVTRFKRLH